jgi:hypothetical protein
MVTQKISKTHPIFSCNNCNYSCSKKSEWTKHISTRKHQNGDNCDVLVTQKISKKIYTCDKCEKQYNSRNGLWFHKKKCLDINENTDNYDNSENNDNILSNNTIIELVKQNQEFKQLIFEQNNHIIELTKKIGSITNNSNITNNNCITNNKFNLNFFLNEQCKDALNITEFINSLTLKLTDLENFSKLGFAEGISKIFIRGLKELDIYKRPIHCSDLKREVLYVKDENKWEKEKDDKKKLKNVIHHISSKNIKQIPEWVKQNPTCKYSDSKKNDVYLKMISNSMCGINEEETENNLNKIISNVVKEVVIEK